MSIGTTGAIIAGAGVLGAGASIGGAIINSNAAKGAADTAAASQRDAIQAQIDQSNKALGILQDTSAPFIDAQKKAVGNLQAFTDPSNPLYSAEQDFATKQIQAQLASQGLLRSRSQGDSLANLQLGLNQQRLGVNQALAGSGAAQSYGTSVAGLLSGLGSGLASSYGQLGQINAGGILGVGSAAAGGLSGVGNAAQGTAGNLISASYLQQLIDARNGGGGLTTSFPKLPALNPGGTVGSGAYTLPSFFGN